MAWMQNPQTGNWEERPDYALPSPFAPGAPAAPAPAAAPAVPQVAGTPARGGGQYTPEERAYLFQKMPEITAGEEELARTQAYADELRGGAQGGEGKRMDWASQGTRAISGAGAGLANKKMRELRGTMGGQYKDLGMNWPGQKKKLTDEDYGWTPRGSVMAEYFDPIGFFDRRNPLFSGGYKPMGYDPATAPAGGIYREQPSPPSVPGIYALPPGSASLVGGVHRAKPRQTIDEPESPHFAPPQQEQQEAYAE